MGSYNTKESRIRTSIKKGLQRKFGGKWICIHGGPFQEAGISDIIGLCQSKFFAIEVKVPGKEDHFTDLQQQFIREIEHAGGYGKMVVSKTEAINFVQEVLGGT